MLSSLYLHLHLAYGFVYHFVFFFWFYKRFHLIFLWIFVSTSFVFGLVWFLLLFQLLKNKVFIQLSHCFYLCIQFLLLKLSCFAVSECVCCDANTFLFFLNNFFIQVLVDAIG